MSNIKDYLNGIEKEYNQFQNQHLSLKRELEKKTQELAQLGQLTQRVSQAESNLTSAQMEIMRLTEITKRLEQTVQSCAGQIPEQMRSSLLRSVEQTMKMTAQVSICAFFLIFR